MGQEIIDIGAAPNDGLGDPIRTAFGFTNDNFTQLFAYPNPAPPSADDLRGKPGDVPGMYAYSSQYFYYCFGTYDGVTLIWSKVPSLASNALASPGTYIANGATQVYTYSNGNVTITVGGASNVAVFTPNGVVVRGGISATGSVSTAGNVTGNYVYGNGAFLTGIAATGATYSNANVASYLPTYSGNIGNVLTTNILASNQISAHGDIITDGRFIGTFQGNITGNLVVPGSNTQVIYNNNGAANASSGLTFNRVGNVLSVIGSICSPTVNTNRVNANSMLVSGAVQANTVITSGAGSFSNGIYAGNSIISTGNISAIGNIYGNYIFGNFAANATNAAYAINANTVLSASQPNIFSVGNTLTVGNVFINGISNTANISIINTHSIVGNTIIANTVNSIAITGTLYTGAQNNITSIGTLANLSVTGNIISGNISTGSFVTNTFTVSGNLSSGNNISAPNNLSIGGNTVMQGTLSVGGNVSTAGSIVIGGTGNIANNLTVGGNISSGSITSNGVVSAQGGVFTQGTISSTGNVYTAGYFVGNFQGNVSGNFTIPGSNTQVVYNSNGVAGAAAGFTFTSGPNTLSVLGPIIATGNISSGGNVSAAKLTSATSICASANITTAGCINAGGVIHAGNFSTAGCVTVGGVVNATQINGNINAPGNVGQILINYNALISGATGLTYSQTTGLMSATGNISARYAVTANSIIGNVLYGSLANGNQPNVSIVGSVLKVGSTGLGNIIVGNINATKLYGVVATTSQPCIVQLGTLLSLCVNGQISTTGNIFGCGQGITNINGCIHVSGVVPYAAVLHSPENNPGASLSWTISAYGTSIGFYYGATKVASIDSSGNIIASKNVIGYGTP